MQESEGRLFDSGQRQAEEQFRYVVRVALESGADAEFDYGVPQRMGPIVPGQRVEVPFGKKDKREVGFCTACLPVEQWVEQAQYRGRLKRVVRVIDEEPLLDEQLLALARWISEYYVCPVGQVLGAMVPAAAKRGVGVRRYRCVYLCSGGAGPADLRGARQKQIVAWLQARGAFDESRAVAMDELRKELGCSLESVRRLIERGVVKVVSRVETMGLAAVPERVVSGERVVLNEDQRKALRQMRAGIESGRFGVTVVHGVTDSGKTELYMRAIETVLGLGKQAIVLLPEIALTTQTVQRFSARFSRVAVMHSGLTAAERAVQWRKIRAGQAEVVIGARSAVFAPVPRLGLIVVDEEHEGSYKQDTVPRYHGRDVAIKRAQLAGAHCILGSATPSLETLYNSSRKGHYQIVRLPRRVMDLPMPEMRLVDMREQVMGQRGTELISQPLAEALEMVLKRGEQAILLLNRRGHSSFVFCPACKYALHCRNCDVTLTFHKSRRVRVQMRTAAGKYVEGGFAMCHYCMAQTLVPEDCPVCGKKMAMYGIGSQKLEEELAEKFPGVRVARVDSDAMSGRDYHRVLGDFGRGRIDVLAGTQMLAKGLHFPNVTLVGVVSADTALYLPDFRASERTFQMICQVAGRAGRSSKRGVVYVQTFLPEQPAIRFAMAGDFKGFVRQELEQRRACRLPPFWRLAVIMMRDMRYEKLEAAGKAMRGRVDDIVQRFGLEVVVRGPMAAPISRVQRQHRMQILLQTRTAETMRRLLSELRQEGPVRPTVKVAVDVDPASLL